MSTTMLDALTDALWDECCPSIRRTDEDTAEFERGVIAVLRRLREPTPWVLFEGLKHSAHPGNTLTGMLDAIIAEARA